MTCQYPDCNWEAEVRTEFDNLLDDRRIVGFDHVQGKVQVTYYCREHFRQQLRDILEAKVDA